MSDDEVMLKRFRAAAAALPGDLAGWAVEVLEAAVDAERFEIRDTATRNAILRRAGAHAGGSTWARARALRDAIVGAPEAVPGVRVLVAEAQERDAARPLPRSVRHLFRLLAS
jgi:hypothetical protein